MRILGFLLVSFQQPQGTKSFLWGRQKRNSSPYLTACPIFGVIIKIPQQIIHIIDRGHVLLKFRPLKRQNPPALHICTRSLLLGSHSRVVPGFFCFIITHPLPPLNQSRSNQETAPTGDLMQMRSVESTL